MAYSTNKLLTTADCDKAIKAAQNRKSDFSYEQTVLDHQLSSKAEDSDELAASLSALNTRITAMQASIDLLPDGDDKLDEQTRLRRLNDKKDNLLDRLRKRGPASLLDAELEAKLIELQLAEIDTYLAAVNTRKAALA
jgi:hypothetical protein